MKSSIKEVKEKTIPIFRVHPVQKVILFGSYAKDEAANNSDIDLYIDTGGKLRGLDFVGLLEKLVDALGKDVDLIDKTHLEPNSPIFQEIENGGIVLYEESKDSEKNNKLH
ncbi:MAG: nucleotidyltransferase domain-containing protein [Clostridia bacterium]|nr:nucleotidyltransferase domain-containing protein [Clostridia bacterium]MDD4145685.1 nucleotidyltransferase domain-containing protein [Clostridia bacterium]MDD4665189.1 nucleotidyltransferase domain-containing protein [Clostridia bacterium]